MPDTAKTSHVYYYFAPQISGAPASTGKPHDNLHYHKQDLRLRIDFYWHAFIEQSALNRIEEWKVSITNILSLL